MKYMRWAFWRVVYLFLRKPRDLTDWLTKSERIRPPWWQFRPNVWHNDDGRMWHVWLDNESAYTKSEQDLRVELHVGQETGRIVGFNVWDENLRPAQAEG